MKNVCFIHGAAAHELQLRRLQINFMRRRFWPTSGAVKALWWPKEYMV